MKHDEVISLFKLAGIPVLGTWELMNQYWPRGYDEDIDPFNKNPERSSVKYWQLIVGSPWWLVKTSAGMIRIGWRKRVIEIDWSDTPIRKIVTDAPDTKSETMVHAWNIQDALKYLTVLAGEISSREVLTPTTAR